MAAAFGITLGLMNWAIYSAMDRIPLGVAVTIEFIGPLGVAVSPRAGRSTCCGSCSRQSASCSWPTRAADRSTALGVAFALLAAAMWAAYILLSVRTGRLFAGGSGLRSR